jgi:hypothetical protein
MASAPNMLKHRDAERHLILTAQFPLCEREGRKMYFRLYFKPDRRPHPKRIFDIVNVEFEDMPVDISPEKFLIQLFRQSGKLTLEFVYSRPSIDGSYRIITHHEPKDYLASDLETIQECDIGFVHMTSRRSNE